jgi:hypothetical protein
MAPVFDDETGSLRSWAFLYPGLPDSEAWVVLTITS